MHKINSYIFVRSAQPENVYGSFLKEILHAEGLNTFQLYDLDAQPWPELAANDAVLLTRCFLHKEEIGKLLDAVAGGMTLICLQPQMLLAQQLGWRCRTTVTYPGMIKIGSGLPGENLTLQTHLPIPNYEQIEPAQAWRIYAEAVGCGHGRDGGDQSDGPGADIFPAIVSRPYHQGSVTFFFYDLPAAVAAIRFGNPALASYVTRGKRWNWPHAADLFTGHLDPHLASIPQADQHAQLLAKIITDQTHSPMPRLWYYSRAQQLSAAVFESDGDGSTVEQFEELSDCLVAHQASASFYLIRHTKLSPENVNNLRAQGHTFGAHVFGVDGEDDLYFRFPYVLREETALFRQKFGTCSRTIQSHYAPWMGYMSWVPPHIEEGFKLLFVYMSIPFGTYMCGSGRPLRFYDTDGTLYDCWQQPLIIFDDTTMIDYLTKQKDQALEQFRALLEGALQQTHTTLSFLSHPCSFATYSRPFMEACLDILHSHNIPVLNGDQWLDFQEQRAAVTITCQTNSGGKPVYLVEKVACPITVMIPVPADKPNWRITVNGQLYQAMRTRRLYQNYDLMELDPGAQKQNYVIEIS